MKLSCFLDTVRAWLLARITTSRDTITTCNNNSNVVQQHRHLAQWEPDCSLNSCNITQRNNSIYSERLATDHNNSNFVLHKGSIATSHDESLAADLKAIVLLLLTCYEKTGQDDYILAIEIPPVDLGIGKF